jgi:hypothetical protein
MVRGFIQAADDAGTEFGRWQQILTALPSRIQPRYRLIEIRAHPADQPGSRHEVSQSLAQRRSLTGLSTTGHG